MVTVVRPRLDLHTPPAVITPVNQSGKTKLSAQKSLCDVTLIDRATTTDNIAACDRKIIPRTDRPIRFRQVCSKLHDVDEGSV